MTDELDDFEPPGVLSYAPLMWKLQQDGYTEEDKKQIAIGYFSFSLFSARYDNDGLNDIKNMVKNYPEIAPIILNCALSLREKGKSDVWIKRESKKYKDFITNLENLR